MVRDSHDSTGRHQRCDDGRTEHLADYGKKLCPVDYAAMETAIEDKISSGRREFRALREHRRTGASLAPQLRPPIPDSSRWQSRMYLPPYPDGSSERG